MCAQQTIFQAPLLSASQKQIFNLKGGHVTTWMKIVKKEKGTLIEDHCLCKSNHPVLGFSYQAI